MSRIKWLLAFALFLPTLATAGDLRWPGSGYGWGRFDDRACERRPSSGYYSRYDRDSRYDRGYRYDSPFSYDSHYDRRDYDRGDYDRRDRNGRWAYDSGSGRWNRDESRADRRPGNRNGHHKHRRHGPSRHHGDFSWR